MSDNFHINIGERYREDCENQIREIFSLLSEILIMDSSLRIEINGCDIFVYASGLEFMQGNLMLHPNAPPEDSLYIKPFLQRLRTYKHDLEIKRRRWK